MTEIRKRIHHAVHVLRGRPLIYGVTFSATVQIPSIEQNRHMWLDKCHFENPDDPERVKWAVHCDAV